MTAATTWVLSWTIIQPVFSLFALSRGVTIVQLGVLYSVQSFVPLIFRIPMSVLAERIGRIRILKISLAISATAPLFYIYAQNYYQILLVVIYSAISNGIFNQTAMSTASDAAPITQQGDAIGKYLTFLGIGMLIGPALCSLLIGYYSYIQLLQLSSIFPIIGILLLTFYAPQTIREQTTREKPKIGTTESLRMITKNRNVLLLSYVRTSFATSQAIFTALFAVYAVNQLGISESSVALLFTIRGFSNALARYPAGRISDRIGRKTPMIIAYSALVIAFIFIAMTKNVVVLAVALLLYGLSWGTRAVCEWALLTDLVDPEIKIISIAYLASVFGVGSTIGSAVAGALTILFPYSTIFLMGAALNLGAIPAILAMKKTSPDS